MGCKAVCNIVPRWAVLTLAIVCVVPPQVGRASCASCCSLPSIDVAKCLSSAQYDRKCSVLQSVQESEFLSQLKRGGAMRLRGGVNYHMGVDLKPVIIRGGSAPKSSASTGDKQGDTVRRGSSPKGPRPKNDDDIGPPQEMPHELKLAIMKARDLKKMNQKQLALALNIPVQDIQWVCFAIPVLRPP